VKLSAEPIGDAIQTLLRFRSPEAPVVSMYWAVPDNPGQLKAGKSRLHDAAKAVRERAESRGLSRAARVSLRVDAERILELEELLPFMQGRTLAIFRCSQLGFEVAVILPGWVHDRIEVDATPFIRPLLAVLDESHRYAVVIVDREHGRLYEFYLGELEATDREDGQVLRKPNYAYGDKEYHVRNKAEELARRHYRQTAQALAHFVQEQNIELVVVGGHEDTVPAFLDLLPHDLRKKVVGTFIADPHTLTPPIARDLAQLVIDDYERREEEELVARAMESVATGGLGAVGLDWCLIAANAQAVENLLIQADVSAPGWVCDTCGWLSTRAGECPVDGNPIRATPDVIDDMAAKVLDASGHVEHVWAETPLRDHTAAALLRFPVPQPAAQD
jgi:peptide chain release factor subunit 1